jgi:RNA polymerase sigma-70 factor (ECF subfamily)
VVTFEDIYGRYAGHVRRFAIYLSGDPSLADDITSETFVRAWTSAAPIRPSTVKGYLFAIARNLFLEEARKRRREADLDFSIADSADLASATAGKEALRQTLEDLRTIPESERSALVMRAVEEMSYEEIAAALGISTVAVKARIHRARWKLAQLQEEREIRI